MKKKTYELRWIDARRNPDKTWRHHKTRHVANICANRPTDAMLDYISKHYPDIFRMYMYGFCEVFARTDRVEFCEVDDGMPSFFVKEIKE